VQIRDAFSVSGVQWWTLISPVIPANTYSVCILRNMTACVKRNIGKTVKGNAQYSSQRGKIYYENLTPNTINLVFCYYGCHIRFKTDRVLIPD